MDERHEWRRAPGCHQAATTNNLELAVHNSGGTNVVYAGVVNNGQLGGLFRSTDQGANWTQLDTPVTNEGGTIVGINPRPKPGGQGGVHFSILADATNPNLVYVGGDRQPNNNGFPNAVGANDFSGRLFRCDASLAANTQCTSLTHNGTPNNSAPHADSREMVFDVNGDIVETDDGGVYRQTDPSTTNGVWQSLNGNLQISEHQSCDYDSVGNIILCGDQDTGAPEQSAAGSLSWLTLSAGDGGFVAVNDSGATSVRFSSSNSLGAGSFLRRACTPRTSASTPRRDSTSSARARRSRTSSRTRWGNRPCRYTRRCSSTRSTRRGSSSPRAGSTNPPTRSTT